MSEFKIGEKVLLVDTRVLYPRHVREGGIYSVLKVNGDFITLTDDAKSFSECVYAHRLSKIVLLDKEKEMEQTAEQIRNEIIRINSRIEEANKDIEKAQEERNSLVEKLREKGFTLAECRVEDKPSTKGIQTLDEVVIGETYIVTNNFGMSGSIPRGRKVVVTDIDFDAYELFVYAKDVDREHGDWMHYQDLAKI